MNLNQIEFIDKLQERFGTKGCSTASTPLIGRLSLVRRKTTSEEYQNLVGSLLHLVCWSRTDNSFAVSELTWFVSEPFEAYGGGKICVEMFAGVTRNGTDLLQTAESRTN